MEEKVIKNIGIALSDSENYANLPGLSLQNLFITQTGKFPSCYMFTQDGRSGNDFDVNAIIDYFKNNTPDDENLEIIDYSTKNLDDSEVNSAYSLVFHKSNIYTRIEKNVGESYILYLNENADKMFEIEKVLEKFYIAPEEEEGTNVYTLAQSNAGFYLAKSKVNGVEDFDINLQYNDDFVEIDDLIKDFIETKGKSGITILHGDKGTGKTTYIRHLINEYKEIKFVTIPPAMVSYLNDPSFTSFMHNRLNDTVIILEDCENALLDRKINEGSSSSVSVLLNIGDGLMSDDLGIKFICTFNADYNKIDSALLRKGRLAVKYEFKNLNKEKAQALLPSIIENKVAEYEATIEEVKSNEELSEEKKNEKVVRYEKKIAKLKEITSDVITKDMSLADIYNIDEMSFEKERKTISF